MVREVWGCGSPDPEPKVYVNNHDGINPNSLHFWLVELVQKVQSAGRQDLIEAVNYGKLDQWLKSDRSKK